MARPRTFTPEEAARRDKQQKAASAKRRAPTFNERRREKRFRFRDQHRQGYGIADNALSVINQLGLRRPNLLYIDPEGAVHSEIWESAEELIDRIEREKKKKERKCQKKNPHRHPAPSSTG